MKTAESATFAGWFCAVALAGFVIVLGTIFLTIAGWSLRIFVRAPALVILVGLLLFTIKEIK